MGSQGLEVLPRPDASGVLEGGEEPAVHQTPGKNTRRYQPGAAQPVSSFRPSQAQPCCSLGGSSRPSQGGLVPNYG